MKFLAATRQTQGQRKNDFCHVPEDEFVSFGFECDGETIDGTCGCRRSMCGINSHTATTTMKVVEISEEQAADIKKRLYEHYKENWQMSDQDAMQDAGSYFKTITKAVNVFPVHAIIEKRGNTFRLRERG